MVAILKCRKASIVKPRYSEHPRERNKVKQQFVNSSFSEYDNSIPIISRRFLSISKTSNLGTSLYSSGVALLQKVVQLIKHVNHELD